MSAQGKRRREAGAPPWGWGDELIFLPCKGSTNGRCVASSLCCPYRATLRVGVLTQGGARDFVSRLPWADLCRPFGADGT